MESIMIKSVVSFLLVFLAAGVAMAADGGAASGSLAPIGIGLAIGLAVLGGAMGQGGVAGLRVQALRLGAF